MPQILIEDRCELHPRLFIEVVCNILGQDVPILEVLIVIADELEPKASSSMTLRSVFRKRAPLKYWSLSGGRAFTPRGPIIGARFLTFDL